VQVESSGISLPTYTPGTRVASRLKAAAWVLLVKLPVVSQRVTVYL
jgi:hypothetical protein